MRWPACLVSLMMDAVPANDIVAAACRAEPDCEDEFALESNLEQSKHFVAFGAHGQVRVAAVATVLHTRSVIFYFDAALKSVLNVPGAGTFSTFVPWQFAARLADAHGTRGPLAAHHAVEVVADPAL